jgi:hypothetical protein
VSFPCCFPLLLQNCRLFVDVLDAAGSLLGSMSPLDTSSGSSLATAGEVSSFCLRFNGSFRARGGGLQWLRPGQVYRLRARLRGPLAAADQQLQRSPSKQVVRSNVWGGWHAVGRQITL